MLILQIRGSLVAACCLYCLVCIYFLQKAPCKRVGVFSYIKLQIFKMLQNLAANSETQKPQENEINKVVALDNYKLRRRPFVRGRSRSRNGRFVVDNAETQSITWESLFLNSIWKWFDQIFDFWGVFLMSKVVGNLNLCFLFSGIYHNLQTDFSLIILN